MTAKKNDSAIRQDAEVQHEFGILFELEALAFRGRAVMYNVCQAVLGQKKLDLNRSLFFRFFLNKTLEQAVSRLATAENKKVSAEKLVAEIKTQYEEEMKKNAGKPESAIASLISEAATEQFALVAISSLSEEAAVMLADRILPSGAVKVLSVCQENGGLSARECWLSAAKMAKVGPRRCLALVSSAASCRAALASGMRCAALPDEFTAFQDFAGADFVADNFEEISAAKLFKLVKAKTVSFR